MSHSHENFTDRAVDLRGCCDVQSALRGHEDEGGAALRQVAPGLRGGRQPLQAPEVNDGNGKQAGSARDSLEEEGGARARLQVHSCLRRFSKVRRDCCGGNARYGTP